MSSAAVANHQGRPRVRTRSSGSRGASPACSTRSDAQHSVAGSVRSTGQKSKGRITAYPKKGSTLGDMQLSPEEEEHFQQVLEKFDKFKQKEELRVRQLREELVEKQKIRIRNAEASGDGHCYNCGRLFVLFLNQPMECHICKHEFCRTCLEKMPKSKQVFCKFCHFESIHRSRLGVWFAEELRLARAAGRVRGVSGPEALRSSLMRIKRESRANSLVEHLDGQAAAFTEREGENLALASQLPAAESVTPRTETWVQESGPPPSIILPDSASTGNKSSRGSQMRSSSYASLVKSSSMGSLNYQQSQNSGSRTSGGRRTPSGSQLDVRDSSRPGNHRRRLDSETTQSQSNLSVASQRFGSMTSVYSENESSYTHGIQITGDLRLDIQYDHQSSTLRVIVKQARDLAIGDKKHETSNAYVKAYLLPDKTKASKRKSSVRKRNRNPVFEEEFKYHIPYSELSERSIQISVWHKPLVGSSLFLGEVIIPFYDIQFDAGAQWYPLSERRQTVHTPGLQIYRGEIFIALRLMIGGSKGSQSELQVWIKSAKGLSVSSSHHSKSTHVDPYAKVYLLPKRSKESKRKTKVVKNMSNPEWNTSFVYKNIDRDQLQEMGVEISVWDHDRFSSNDFLGGCRLNNGSMKQPWMDAKGTEKSLWQAMLSRPQTWFEGEIRLRPNLD